MINVANPALDLVRMTQDLLLIWKVTLFLNGTIRTDLLSKARMVVIGQTSWCALIGKIGYTKLYQDNKK